MSRTPYFSLRLQSRVIRPPKFSLGVAFALAAVLFSGSPASAASKFTLMLNWLPGGSHVPIFYARDAGFYKKAGVAVNILSARGSRNAFEALRKGKAHFAIAEAAELFIQRGGGLDALGTMVYFNRSPNTIFTLQRADIRGLADLAGKRLAAPRTSFPRVLFKELGARGKINLKKIRWLNLSPGELLPALVEGKIDAVASSTMVAHQYRKAARRKGKKIAVYPYADAGVNPYSLLLISMESVLAKDPTAAAAFVRATAEGLAAALERPREAFRVFLRGNPGQEPERARAEWREALSLIHPKGAGSAGLGQFEKGRMENTRKILSGIRNLRPGTSSADLYTNRLLPVLRPKPGSL